jgi:transcriptional regulator with XRE-family HTH domain
MLKSKARKELDFRTLRVSKGFTQFEVARRSRLHPSTVSRIENGRYRPYPAEARRLARTLGVTLRDIEALR